MEAREEGSDWIIKIERNRGGHIANKPCQGGEGDLKLIAAAMDTGQRPVFVLGVCCCIMFP